MYIFAVTLVKAAKVVIFKQKKNDVTMICRADYINNDIDKLPARVSMSGKSRHIDTYYQ